MADAVAPTKSAVRRYGHGYEALVHVLRGPWEDLCGRGRPVHWPRHLDNTNRAPVGACAATGHAPSQLPDDPF